VVSYLKSSVLEDSNEDDDMEFINNQRLMERWKFDSDDYPPNGPDGLDEQDRVLIDDYDPRCYPQAYFLLFSDHHQNRQALLWP
jgi:enhancer of polycomb-like protein